jgi:hypothetical protein
MLVRIVVAILTMVDKVLSVFVVDINSTTLTGNETVSSIATIIHYGTELYAQLLLIFVGLD